MARRATSRSCVTRMTVKAFGPVEFAEEGHDVPAGARVQVAGRLVAEQDRRLVDQRPRDGDALLLAAGELVRPVVRAVGQADAAEQLERLPLAPGSRTIPVIQERRHHIFQGGRPRQQVEVLEDEADAPVADLGQLVRVKARHFLAGEAVAAVGGAVEAAQGVHERRFPGAGRADQGDELPLFDVQRHLLKRQDLHLPQVIRLAQVPQFDQGHPRRRQRVRVVSTIRGRRLKGFLGTPNVGGEKLPSAIANRPPFMRLLPGREDHASS